MTTQNESAVLDISLPTPPSFRLDGKRALVTGAGRGIGLAGAAAMAKAGAHVTLVARSSAEIESLARAIERDGGRAEAATLDVTDIGRVERVLSSLEPVEILVNSAGANQPAAFLDVTAEQYDTIMALNVRSLFFVSQVVARPCARRVGPVRSSTSPRRWDMWAPQPAPFIAARNGPSRA
jgi:NAD(P)-dependent dehydrogenase (short-subunit alcohol dehydrogenase family)